jgi:hypothetical protein
VVCRRALIPSEHFAHEFAAAYKRGSSQGTREAGLCTVMGPLSGTCPQTGGLRVGLHMPSQTIGHVERQAGNFPLLSHPQLLLSARRARRRKHFSFDLLSFVPPLQCLCASPVASELRGSRCRKITFSIASPTREKRAADRRARGLPPSPRIFKGMQPRSARGNATRRHFPANGEIASGLASGLPLAVWLLFPGDRSLKQEIHLDGL